MSALKLPRKLVSLFVLTYRSLFLLYEGLAVSLVSMRLRLTMHNTRYQWRSLSAIFAATLTRAAFRSEKVWVAMSSRGFDGGFPVTVSFKWKAADSLLLGISIAFSIIIFMYRL
jgi:cobalt/nickel transport system permease protein